MNGLAKYAWCVTSKNGGIGEEMSNTRHYIFDGCDTVGLAERYGTPLYVVSESEIVRRCREIRRDFIDKHPGNRAFYACKAFLTLDMAKLIGEQGLGFDVASGGELFTVLKSGADPSNIVFHGNNKSFEECCMALDNRVGTIVADNYSELDMLDDIAGRRGIKAEVLLRVTPGVDSDTHQYISTGHLDSKFGFSPQSLLEDEGVLKTLSLSNVRLKGFHFHVGSQLVENSSHLMAMDIMLEFIKDVRDKTGYIPLELNMGGGYGIQYAGDPKRKPLAYFTDPMMQKLIKFCGAEKMPIPRVSIEPGRFVSGEAGITIYRIGTIKTTPGKRVYAGVDGGFPDNPRTALYQAKYEVKAIGKQQEKEEQVITIAGKCCESGDILIWDALLPKLDRGDLIAVLCTGAYNYSMASNYNRIPRPALVMVNEGEDRLSVRRETYEDMLAREMDVD